MNLLDDLFITVVNMSIAASCVAVGVVFVRLLLNKAPKIFSYLLWAPVLFRLVCPFSFNSEFSFFNLINLSAGRESGAYGFVPHDIGLMNTPAVGTGTGNIDNGVNASLPEDVYAASVDPMQIWVRIFSLIWVFGVIGLLIYSIVSYVKVKKNLQTATRLAGNVFETDAINTAFVCGFIRPKIYVPVNIGDANLSYILEHERTHIRRKDYLIKLIAFLALILHWFNPLMWLCFALMNRDMEMSCDESVLHRLGDGVKADYSSSLLLLSVKGKGILTANPLAFGESHVKARIKNILNFKRPAFWVIMIAVITVCATAFAFTANPKGRETVADNTRKDVSEITSEKSMHLDKLTNYTLKDTPGTDEIAKLVEENLAVIMSSPKEASNPQDHIQAHQKEYENIKKLGGEQALHYMLSQFEKGNAEGLRGYIMMQLCKDILGARNNVTDENLTPQEWYDALSIRKEIRLPDFKYDGKDPIEKLIYATELEKYSRPQEGFTIVAPKIFGSYEEDGLLKVFVTTYSSTYKLYGNVLDMVGGSVVPSAITYRKDESGNYVLEKYEQAKDGTYFVPSIREFCTMPVSGKEIPGLADKIIRHYGNYDDIRTLQRENLFKHLKANGIKKAVLYNSRGEIEFLMSEPQYAN